MGVQIDIIVSSYFACFWKPLKTTFSLEPDELSALSTSNCEQIAEGHAINPDMWIRKTIQLYSNDLKWLEYPSNSQKTPALDITRLSCSQLLPCLSRNSGISRTISRFDRLEHIGLIWTDQRLNVVEIGIKSHPLEINAYNIVSLGFQAIAGIGTAGGGAGGGGGGGSRVGCITGCTVGRAAKAAKSPVRIPRGGSAGSGTASTSKQNETNGKPNTTRRHETSWWDITRWLEAV